MVTVLISFYTQNQLQYKDSQMDCYFGSDELEILKKGVRNQLCEDTGNDLNGGWFAVLNKWNGTGWETFEIVNIQN